MNLPQNTSSLPKETFTNLLSPSATLTQTVSNAPPAPEVSDLDKKMAAWRAVASDTSHLSLEQQRTTLELRQARHATERVTRAHAVYQAQTDEELQRLRREVALLREDNDHLRKDSALLRKDNAMLRAALCEAHHFTAHMPR